MEYKKISNVYVMKLIFGDEIIRSIKEVITRENIKFCKIEGIGRVKNVTLAYLPKNDYIKKEFKGSFELVTLLGNALGPSRIHLHATIARDKTLDLVGGHLLSAEIDDNKIAELFITTFNVEMQTKKEENIPFATLDLNSLKQN